MALWAIVPVNPLGRGKSRLADVFDQHDRINIYRHLLNNTIETLMEIPEIEQVLVVSRDPGVLSLARDSGAKTVKVNSTESVQPFSVIV